MPIVSYRPMAAAIAVFVPTPSVDDTITGSRTPVGDRERRPEPAEAAEDLRPARRLDGRPHQRHRAVAGGHVHAGPA